jgi:hypothetical protein
MKTERANIAKSSSEIQQQQQHLFFFGLKRFWTSLSISFKPTCNSLSMKNPIDDPVKTISHILFDRAFHVFHRTHAFLQLVSFLLVESFLLLFGCCLLSQFSSGSNENEWLSGSEDFDFRNPLEDSKLETSKCFSSN